MVGSWAASVYTFSQTSVADDVLLGPIVDPSDIDLNNLNEMNAACARKVTDVEMVKLMIEYQIETNSSLFDSWKYAVQTVYLDPFEILAGHPFAYNQLTVQEIKRKNPTLQNVSFVTSKACCGRGSGKKEVVCRPISLIASTMVGPSTAAPFTTARQNFSFLEVTPVGAGLLYSRDLVFTNATGCESAYRVGGVVEPFAFGAAGVSPANGLR